MSNTFIYSELSTFLREDQILENAQMKDHTSFKAGGKADLLLLPEDECQVKSIIEVCKKNSTSYYIMGNGSNLLVRDKGYHGIIIKLSKNFANCTLVGDTIECQSGASLARISRIAHENSLEGFEFAGGIPGTLGGAVTMNAGAYDGEIKDVLISARGLDMDGNIHELINGELDFGYRTSAVQRRNLIVLSAKIKLKSGNQKAIKEKMDDFDQRRKSKQPLDMPSAGSTFKRPAGHFAGKLIEDCDLKGFSIGGAQVSCKHCGFVINKGDATASDITALIDHIHDTVKARFNVILEPEVKIIGEE
ncbi:UDP-N-acetylmuramate dehydrogenase [Alkalibacter mobilis]|uniref:UDP-N-acetylmuramate dehydrogenase n=1 Tax=Alkalibacter mobilis TaxID=2787712 RepID=UPI00189E733F|nr:UDP-N-acetylmuramate dehydrogenase [Alkalibacter mobilis]MBF7095924.1 UDP-N-acetylmuramate dehydrogenase [Alkalibacter mobilis]